MSLLLHPYSSTIHIPYLSDTQGVAKMVRKVGLFQGDLIPVQTDLFPLGISEVHWPAPQPSHPCPSQK